MTLHYDSMLAKLIVWAPDRRQAIDRMVRALDELVLSGVATNQGFHRRLLADPAFREGDIDVQFLERHADLLQPTLSDDDALRSPSVRRWPRTRLDWLGVRPWPRMTTGSPRGSGAHESRDCGDAGSDLRLATGGDGVGKLDDGRTVFVPRTAPAIWSSSPRYAIIAASRGRDSGACWNEVPTESSRDVPTTPGMNVVAASSSIWRSPHNRRRAALRG